MAEITNKELLIRIDERTKRLMTDYEELKVCIMGDGKTGIVGNVLLNSTAIEKIQDSTLRRDEFWQKVILLFIAFFITNIGGVIIAVSLLTGTTK